jgi:hypothetical protein
MNSPSPGHGATLTVLTTSPTSGISIFPNIVAHAGPNLPRQSCPIESKLLEKVPGPTSTSLLNPSSLANLPCMDVKVETISLPTIG